MAFHTNYWTCSKFADWIRGTPKPGAATMEDWQSWRVQAKASHPIRYWIADELLDFLQDMITYPATKLNDVRYYLVNRYSTRSNSLTAHPRDIAPGSWCDVGNRFLPCMFNELVDFVEIEKAWMQCCWGQEENQAKYNMPWWRNHWWSRLGQTWRCPQAGLDHLEWEINLLFNDEWMDKNDPKYGKPTPQAISAMEIKELYLWWTVERPKRPDPYEASGWTALCADRRAGGDSIWLPQEKTAKDRKASKTALDKLTKIEAAYEKEDERMMIRLIKVRQSLWS